MSLPIVMLFNRHWDITPQLLIKEMLPGLSKEGYDSFCEERSSALSEQDIFNDMENHIGSSLDYLNIFNQIADLSKLPCNRNLNDLTLSELQYALPNKCDYSDAEDMTYAIKHLQAHKRHRDNLFLAKEMAFQIHPIDDPLSVNEVESVLGDSELEYEAMKKTQSVRESVMADRLFHMHSLGAGIIVSLGCNHFKNMVELLQKRGLGEEDIVCHFPHTMYRYRWPLKNDLENLIEKGSILINKTTSATSDEEIYKLSLKLLSEVKSKKELKKELLKNCHIQFLSEYFNVNFKPHLRPEYCLDAVLSFTKIEEISAIREKLHKFRIVNQKTESYLIIPNVNTTDIAHRIRLLPYKV
jgi:hypothetical protein